MPFLANFIRSYCRSGVRGSWRVADLLAKNFKSLHAVEIETDHGRVYADLRIGSARGLLASPRCLSGEAEIMRRFVKPGDIAFDIGAHLGFYSILLSTLTGPHGKVFAFEPNPELLPSLRRTLAERDNIELFEVALSNEPGEIELFVPEDASMASLSDWTEGTAGLVHSVSCKVKVLDEMYESGSIGLPHFIKCDVEGAELLVFSGAKTILDRSDAPVVLFELNERAANSFGRTTAEYFGLFESHRRAEYKFFEVLPDGIREFESRGVPYTNVLAVPTLRL